MLFGQQTAATGPWFHQRLGQAHSIPVTEWPHFLALEGDHDAYLDYLKVSWSYYRPKSNTPQERAAQLARLLTTDNSEPVKVVRRPDGEMLVVDGNHRTAVAFHRGAEPDIIEIPAATWLEKSVANPTERYGTRPGLPYQSVFHDGREIIQGRRRDTLTRHQAIAAEDVLDLGCNIGAATFLAGGHGVDTSPRMITSAWRLAAYLASPATFDVADLNTQAFESETVFCFAVIAHLTDLTAVRATLSNAETVYFEENDGRAQFPKVADLFTQVEELAGDRRLYRCR